MKNSDLMPASAPVAANEFRSAFGIGGRCSSSLILSEVVVRQAHHEGIEAGFLVFDVGLRCPFILRQALR